MLYSENPALMYRLVCVMDMNCSVSANAPKGNAEPRRPMLHGYAQNALILHRWFDTLCVYMFFIYTVDTGTLSTAMNKNKHQNNSY